MYKANILIVEDELLIATYIEDILKNNGFNVVDTVISYEDAIECIDNNHTIDFILLDITLSGDKSGIDIADYVNDNYQIPFIYLTSHSDQETLSELKMTKPVGYQPKPISDVGLVTAIELYFISSEDQDCTFTVQSGQKVYHLDASEIQYIETSHVYTYVHTSKSETMIRISLVNFLSCLPSSCNFIRINRSVAVNPSYIVEKTKRMVRIGDKQFTLSKNFC